MKNETKHIIKEYNNRLYNLPEELLDLIFSFYNPYKNIFKGLIIRLEWLYWWYKVRMFWFRYSTLTFNKLVFMSTRRIKFLKSKNTLDNCNDTM